MEEKKLAEQLSQRDGGVGIDVPYLPEAGGVAWTDVYHIDGWRINLTSRAETPLLAFQELTEALSLISSQPITNEFHPVRPAGRSDVHQDAYVDDGVPGVFAPAGPDIGDGPSDRLGEAVPFDDGFPQPEYIPSTDQPQAKQELFPVVPYMKAADKTPNMRYALEAELFKCDGSAIKFYMEGDKYPRLTHSLKAKYPAEQFAEIFNGWQPPIVADRTAIPGGMVILNIQCSNGDSLTSEGNPYSNLVGMRRP